MNATLYQPCSSFSEADEYWDLNRLYEDLTHLKGKALSNREKQWLRGLLLGYSPGEINRLMLGCSNSRSLRPALAQKLYPLIKQLIHEHTGEDVQLGRCCLPILLERLGYRKALMRTCNFAL
jgi:hypothetical protein